MILEYVQRFLTLFLLMKILLYLVPRKNLAKYIAFFSGVVMVIGMIQPVLKRFGADRMLEKTEYKVWESELLGLSAEAAALEAEAAEILKRYEDEEENVFQEYEIEKIEIRIDGQVDIENAE